MVDGCAEVWASLSAYLLTAIQSLIFASWKSLSTADFIFRINFFQNFISGIELECQALRIQIKSDVLSCLVWVQIDCKRDPEGDLGTMLNE